MNTSISSMQYLNASNDSYQNVSLWTETSGNYTFKNESVYMYNNILLYTVYPIVIVTGIFGNVLTLKIFPRKGKSANNLFILSLTASDLSLLSINTLSVIYAFLFLLHPETLTKIAVPPEFVLLLSRFPDRIGKLITVAMMVERFTAVYFPLQLKHIWTISKAKKCISTIALSVCFANIPIIIDVLCYFVGNSRKKDQYDSKMGLFEYMKHPTNWSSVLNVAYKIIFDVVPIVIIFILSVAIAFGISRMRSTKQLRFSPSKVIERKRQEKKITKILMTISLILCFLNSPAYVIFILVRFHVIDDPNFYPTTEVTFLAVLNSAINFFIFGMLDKKLRKEYLEQINCCRKQFSQMIPIEQRTNLKTKITNDKEDMCRLRVTFSKI